jgi:hypothetical protein
MNRLLNVLVAAALASIGGGVLAADDGVEGVREQTKDTYRMDKKSCVPLKGDERRNCLRRTKAQYDQATADAKRMEAVEKEEKAAARAEKRDAKRRAKTPRGDRDSAMGSSKRPAAGAQSAGQRSAEPAPGEGMGRAPVTAGGSPSK